MKKIIIISISVLCIVVISCSGDDPVNTSATKKYPTKLNNEWEYNTETNIDHYDDEGKIINRETFDFGNTIVKIVNIQDTLGSYQNLIKFESFDVLTPNQKKYDWYLNSDSGLVIIAYSNAGATQPVIPKNNDRRYITLNELLSIIKLSGLNIFSDSYSTPLDSIYYYERPRQALAYPLVINKRWVELIYPWYRERYVEKVKIEFLQGQALRCYVIKVDWPGFDVEFNDYVSLDKGLIKREILADSIIITDPAHPDSGGFGRISTYSNLVRIVE